MLKRLAATGVAPIEADELAASRAISAADAIQDEVHAMQDTLGDVTHQQSKEEDDKFVKDVLFRRHAEEESLRCVDGFHGCRVCVCFVLLLAFFHLACTATFVVCICVRV